MTLPLVPRYGERTLAEVLPSLLAAIGVTGFANPLGIAPARTASLLLVDGLGWELLHAYAADAPFLAALAADGAPVFAGFPATTAVSLATLETGRPPGQHGIVGYTFAMPGAGLLNALTWRSHGDGQPVDLRERLPPEQVQPLGTVAHRGDSAPGHKSLTPLS